MIEDNYTSMAEIAKQNSIKVVFASITPAFAYPWKPGIEPVERIVNSTSVYRISVRQMDVSTWTTTVPWRTRRARCFRASPPTGSSDSERI